MNDKNIQILNTFTLDNIPDLDIAVLGALELFQKKPVPKLKLNVYKHPLVVGSGNAEATGRIIFQDLDAIFASESNFEEKLESVKSIDGVVVVSASGEKHAPIIEKVSKKYGKHITLITNSKGSSAERELDKKHQYDEYIFPKNREPYTYNTSTYMGMILGHTGEDPTEIYDFILNKIDITLFPNLANYNKFYLIVPPQFSGIIRMLQVKFIELFGRNIARDVETSEYVPHATTVAPSDELFISFGYENNTWGKPGNRLKIPLPEWVNYGTMMAVGYYIVAQIQKHHPPYFKQNIASYTQFVSQIFKSTINPIVE